MHQIGSEMAFLEITVRYVFDVVDEAKLQSAALAQWQQVFGSERPPPNLSAPAALSFLLGQQQMDEIPGAHLGTTSIDATPL